MVVAAIRAMKASKKIRSSTGRTASGQDETMAANQKRDRRASGSLKASLCTKKSNDTAGKPPSKTLVQASI